MKHMIGAALSAVLLAGGIATAQDDTSSNANAEIPEAQSWESTGEVNVQGERVRYVYQAGGDSDASRFFEDSMAEIERAAERAVVELQGLLCEVRQIDLKLEEVRLMPVSYTHLTLPTILRV